MPYVIIQKNPSTNKYYLQNEDVPFNPLNPDSKP